MRVSVSFLCLSILACHSVYGEVLHVPAAFGTIQSAMNALTEGDTILVAPGTYRESLMAPPLDFMMKGEETVDSTTTEFSVVDPSELPGSDTLLTLRLTGGNTRFEDMVFRNRGNMIADRPQSNQSGIQGDTLVNSVSFERCIFDSLVSAVSRVDSIRVRKCRFVGCRGAVYTGFWRGALYADSTWFDGYGSLVNTQEGCNIEHCLFTHAGPSQFIVGVGDSLIIKHCRFIGRGVLSYSALQLRGRCGSYLTDCVFEEIETRTGGVLEVLDSCYQQPQGEECALRIENNRFVRCGGVTGENSFGGVNVLLRCTNSARGYVATLVDNCFDSTGTIFSPASCIQVNASCRIENSVMGDSQCPGKPQIYVAGRGYSDALVFRNNSLSRFYYGINYGIFPTSEVDARFNWWGNASGPYHGELNPNGTGAQVGDNIMIDPWLTVDPDSSDSNGVNVEHRALPSPTSYSLTPYPNPFNAVTTLEIEVGRGGDYEVILYDVTGRVAAEVFTGRIDRRQSVSLNADGLSSGVYFARLSGGEGALAVSKVLLLK